VQCRLDETKERFSEQVLTMQRMLIDMERNTESYVERLRQQYDKETDELNARLKTYETTMVPESSVDRRGE